MSGYEGYNYIQGSPVLCTQYADEFAELLKIYKKFKPHSVLEIGTHYGGTLWHWLDSGLPDCTVTVVDDHHINQHLYDEWLKGSQDIEVIKGKSQDEGVVRQIKDRRYEWIFIDGGHSYFEVASDWKVAREVAYKNCVVVFHDIVPHRNTEADRLWREIKKQDYATLELVEDWKQDGCGLGVVFL